MRRSALCLVFLLWCAGCAPSSDEVDRGAVDRPAVRAPQPPRHFPVIAPIANADPSIREEREFLVPTRLRIVRSESRIAVEADPDSLQSITLDVGTNMVAGFRNELFIYQDGQLLCSGGSNLGGDWYFGTFNYNTGGFFFPKPGETYEIELRVQIFETDIPAQHMWMPVSPMYKSLWTRTSRQDL